MKVTREPEILSQEQAGTIIRFVGDPDTGASECVLLRGAVPAGAGFLAHSHDHEEIFYVLSGSLSYEIGEQTGSVVAGDVVVIPAGTVHSFEANDDADAVAVLPAGFKTFTPV
jgi:quercetin dioxygenase-like cupin family protein